MMTSEVTNAMTNAMTNACKELWVAPLHLLRPEGAAGIQPGAAPPVNESHKNFPRPKVGARNETDNEVDCGEMDQEFHQ